MAKYIKTEEGYKLLADIEGATPLSAGDYIAIEDNVIRTTFGDPAMITEEFLIEYCDNTIGTMEYYTSFGAYASSPWGIGYSVTPPNNEDILKVELTNSQGTVIFDGYATYFSTTKMATCNSNIKILFSSEYASIGATNIRLISTNNLTGGHLKITGNNLEVVEGYVTLPKNALKYDSVPKKDSENLVTSGVIHNSLLPISKRTNKVLNANGFGATEEVRTEASYPITSQGVYDALGRASLDYDTVPTELSSNIITSGAVYTAIQSLQDQIPTKEILVQSVIDALPKYEGEVSEV